MQRKTLIGAAAVLVAIGLWYAFRPERLFINKTVNESLAADAGTMPADTTVVAMAEPMPASSAAAPDARVSIPLIVVMTGSLPAARCRSSH